MATTRLSTLALRAHPHIVARTYLSSHRFGVALLQRSLHTSPRRRAALEARPTSDLPSSSTIILAAPTEHDLEEAELDVEPINLEEAHLELTDRAAEQLRSIATRENDANVALRISVKSGGCHGYQYGLELTSEKQSDDYKLCHPTVKPSNILVDAVSMPLLKGSTVDFAIELIGSSFRIADNPQAKGSGCGCGVSWELKT